MLSLQLPFSSSPLLRHAKTRSPIHGSHIPRPHSTPNTALTCFRAPTRLPLSVLLHTPTLRSPILIPRAAAAAAAAADGDPDAPPPKEKQEAGFRDLKDGENSITDRNEDDSTGKSMAENESRSKTTTPNNTLYVAMVFGLWYFQNVAFNIYNKKVLNIFPYPWLLASFQLFIGSLWMAFLWASRLQPLPRVSKRFFLALLGPALFHTIGHISACVSFSKVAVSFSHVIKASEPVFSVIFSTFLGRFYPIQVWLSVLPIVNVCSTSATAAKVSPSTTRRRPRSPPRRPPLPPPSFPSRRGRSRQNPPPLLFFHLSDPLVGRRRSPSPPFWPPVSATGCPPTRPPPSRCLPMNPRKPMGSHGEEDEENK